ncbi:hypothetical protein P170DRAFT_430873 [Aspergillus steynii IBT 23096]|uniref:Zn(2)-C6 fungal-type domain-containing protein n=1 Tax=Aspergillus steynii IBT 23096 TaxID=1392250 RepID=A0A2I2FTC1_9EURO|nr:uncharacterized protein P170DRAFT_430873 [Aspergillus steynii IBT 23096]PLB43864.1 hypothetical protein P170DRAFT_430873 [Aspergillus steynii IBT 23096]
MPREVKQPVKAACLACRASKTRCDGQHPCKPCMERSRGCHYQPSRRGGPRRRTKYDAVSQSPKVPHHQPHPVPPRSPSTATPAIDVPDANSVSAPGCPVPPQSIDSSLQSIIGLLSPFSGMQSTDVDTEFLWQPMDTTSSSETASASPILRVYTSEEDIANAYYLYIHPYLSLLPPPAVPIHEDHPIAFQPPPGETCTVESSSLPYWPRSSLSLALCAILALIPPDENPTPFSECSVWMRREYANLYAQAALNSADKEIDELTLVNGSRFSPEQKIIHPNVPVRLHPILALVALSIYEYCQRGNVSRMRTRANQAITTAMDLSIHNLESHASEAQRRAWWTSMFVVLLSSVLQETSPIINSSDPRISTPHPVFDARLGKPEPWPLLIGALETLLAISSILTECGIGGKTPSTSPHLREKIRHMDSHVLSLIGQCDLFGGEVRRESVEGLAAQTMGMVVRLEVHAARTKLHRYRAFMDIPLFLEKHCDLAAIEDKGILPASAYPKSPAEFEAIFPFTEMESSIISLKSSLVISRIFRALPYPSLCRPDGVLEPGYEAMGALPSNPTLSSRYPHGLPYFSCTSMQAGYTLYMLLHRVRAAIVSDRLSYCYPLLNYPDPATEIQDSERLLEELRHGADSLNTALKRNALFEGVRQMAREMDAAYNSTFTGRV